MPRQRGASRLTLDGESFDIGIGSGLEAMAAGGGGAGSGAILAPMPGVVAEVRVAPGDRVEAGQVVIVLGSMKLFTSLSAGIDGVSDVACQPGGAGRQEARADRTVLHLTTGGIALHPRHGKKGCLFHSLGPPAVSWLPR